MFARQGRPFWCGGSNDRHHLGHNVFVMDQQHPIPEVRAAVAAALEVAGFSKRARKDLPRLLLLACELRDDDALRDTYRAMYETYAHSIRARFPALATQILAHLGGLRYAGMIPVHEAMQNIGKPEPDEEPEGGMDPEPPDLAMSGNAPPAPAEQPAAGGSGAAGAPPPAVDPAYWADGPEDVKAAAPDDSAETRAPAVVDEVAARPRARGRIQMRSRAKGGRGGDGGGAVVQET